MAKKKTQKTFSEAHKEIHNKYYKRRKPGDDKLTDEAYNREVKELVAMQEAMKVETETEQPQGQPTHTMPDGTVMPGTMHEEVPQQQFKKGGNLPTYQFPNDGNGNTNFLQDATGASVFDVNNYEIPNIGQEHQNLSYDNQYVPELDPGLNPVVADNQKAFSPTASIIGPLATIATNAISNSILSKNAREREADLLKGINVNLGRVNPIEVDYGRDRANIKSNAALTDAAGRYHARGARSAGEAAAIQNQARIGSQRTAGNLLSQSLQKEENENARLRAAAQAQNIALGAREAEMENRQRMLIENKYGDVPAQLNAELARTTGASLQNYLTENQKMQRDLNYVNMLNPNYELDYQQDFDRKSKLAQTLARLGIVNVNPTKVVK